MVLLMIYTMATNILLVNLLVAMMGSTYDRYMCTHSCRYMCTYDRYMCTHSCRNALVVCARMCPCPRYICVVHFIFVY